MKPIVVLLTVLCLTAVLAISQKRKKPLPRSRATAKPSDSSKPRMIGSTVVIMTKNGDRITGELLDLTAYSVRIKADNLESSIALDTVA
jgi:hypothetical protein